MPSPQIPEKEEGWSERFDEKVNEVRRDTHWGSDQDGPIHDFGLKTQRNGMVTNELFTVTDWGHVKKFIAAEITRARTEAYRQGVQDSVNAGPKDLKYTADMDAGRGYNEANGHWRTALSALLPADNQKGE